MTSRTRALSLAVATMLSATAVSAAESCLIEASACEDIQSKKNANLVKILKAPKTGVDQMTVSVIYSTFEDLQAKSDGCKSAEKVSLKGFKSVFVLGAGANKRALMAKGASNCAWVKVK